MNVPQKALSKMQQLQDRALSKLKGTREWEEMEASPEGGQEEETPKVKPKLVLMGDETVGKTTLIKPFLIDPVDDRVLKVLGVKVAKRVETGIVLESEEVVDSYLMFFEVNGDQLGDMSDERSEVVLGGSNGVVFMCDALRRDSLDEMFYQLEKFFKFNSDPRPIFLLANKVDVLDMVLARESGKSVQSQVREQLWRDDNPFIDTDKQLGLYLKRVQRMMSDVEMEDLLLRNNLEEISTEVLKRFGEAPNIYISAETGRNVQTAFRRVARRTSPKSLA